MYLDLLVFETYFSLLLYYVAKYKINIKKIKLLIYTYFNYFDSDILLFYSL